MEDPLGELTGTRHASVAVISCGALPTPSNGRKSTFAFTPGTMVKFDCDPGYVLVGERRRWCYENGDWNWAEKGDARCMCECIPLSGPLLTSKKAYS